MEFNRAKNGPTWAKNGPLCGVYQGQKWLFALGFSGDLKFEKGERDFQKNFFRDRVVVTKKNRLKNFVDTSILHDKICPTWTKIVRYGQNLSISFRDLVVTQNF